LGAGPVAAPAEAASTPVPAAPKNARRVIFRLFDFDMDHTSTIWDLRVP
jgi:hypothetical protein